MAIDLGTVNFVNLASVNTGFHSIREQFLALLSKGLGPKGIAAVASVAVFAAIFIVIQLRKGKEERKSIAGPVAILLFCVFLFFPIPIQTYAYGASIILSFIMVKRLKNGEWKGVMFILPVIIALGFIVSSNIYVMTGIAAVTMFLAGVIKKRNKERTIGTSEARHMMAEQGWKPKKEIKLIKGMARIAKKGFGFTKDKMLYGARKLKQRFARREGRNLQEQQHEAEVAAAGKELAEAVDEHEQKELEIERRDFDLINKIAGQCNNLEREMEALGENAVDSQRQKDILGATKVVLKDSNQLVEDALDSEKLNAKANKILKKCMHVIEHSTHEIKQLHESKAVYKELRKAADKMIRAMEKEIEHNTKQLSKAEKQAAHSGAEGARNRIALLKQREGMLSRVDGKLKQIDGYIKAIIKKLAKINKREDADLAAVQKIGENAKKHEEKLQGFESKFEHKDKELRNQHKKFNHLFGGETDAIPDLQLTTVTDSTILMFGTLTELWTLTYEYNVNELKPLVGDMAKVAQELAVLSKVANYLTKMYYRLSQAMAELTQMAEIVDQHPDSKGQLKKVLGTQELEEKITGRAYRKGKKIIKHIKSGYKSLQSAYGHLEQHSDRLKKKVPAVEGLKKDVGRSLGAAFKVTLRTEIKQAKALEKDVEKAQSAMDSAKHFEQKAGNVERRAA